MKMNNVELCRWLVWEILESGELPDVPSVNGNIVEEIKSRMNDLPMFSPSGFLKSLGKTAYAIHLKMTKTQEAIDKIIDREIRSHIPLPEVKAYLRNLGSDMKVVNFVMNFVRVHYDVANLSRPLCFKDIELLLAKTPSNSVVKVSE